MDASQSIPVLLDSDDNQALKHKVLELQKENSSLRVSNAKLGRRITVALTSAALSEKHTLLAVAEQPDVSFSAEDALLAHHQSEIAASEAAVTISSLKREIRELRGKNSELQQHINSTASVVSEVEEQCRETSARLAEYQSLYAECDSRNQKLVDQISEEQSRHRQFEEIMVNTPTTC
jgi:septal ring factor EnvC (AmiA/AmiB activator)